MYTSNSEKNLASIKKRMGWQLALQAGTLVGIASLNSAVTAQTDIISDELKEIQDVNVKGFMDIETALNSLESSLIAGFEDLKWYLGSIDDKLARIIGLVEFPKSTESTEQYFFGMELFKQEYYDKSIISFKAAVDKNPLNLNAKVGLYLALKEKDKKADVKLLEEIMHLTDSDFTLNTDVSEISKNNSIIFFSNFVFNELSKLEEYERIIDYFENHMVDVAKKELNIRIRYIASKINTNKDYESDLRIILEDGDLLNLLCFIEYKKDKKFVDFLLKCSEILDETFSKYSKLEFSEDDELCIRRSAATIVKSINNESQLIKLASIKKTLAYKHSILNNFFEKAEEAPNLYKIDELKLTTANISIEKLNKNQDLKFDIEKNEFLADSHKIIRKEINKKLNDFKKKNLDGLATIVKTQKVVLDEFKMNYPAVEDEEQESIDSIVTLISSIDKKNKDIDFNIAFEDLSEVSQDRAEINERLVSIKKSINETVSKVGKTKAIELFSKIKKADGSGVYGKKWAEEMVAKHTS